MSFRTASGLLSETFDFPRLGFDPLIGSLEESSLSRMESAKVISSLWSYKTLTKLR